MRDDRDGAYELAVVTVQCESANPMNLNQNWQLARVTACINESRII